MPVRQLKMSYYADDNKYEAIINILWIILLLNRDSLCSIIQIFSECAFLISLTQYNNSKLKGRSLST